MENLFIELRSLQKKSRICTLSLLVSIALTVVVFAFFGVFGLIFVAADVVLTIFAVKANKKFTALYKDGVVKSALGEVFDDLIFSPEMGISEMTVESTGMMQTGDRFSSNDLVSGKYHGVGFTQSDIHIEDENTDSDGNTTTVTVFKGRWMIFDFNKAFKSDLQIISKHFNASKRKGGIFSKKENRLNRIELESEEFNKNFKVFAQSEQEAFYILTPHIMDALRKLRQGLKSPIMLMFVNGALHIAVQNGKDAFEPKLFGKLNEETEKERILADIKVITSFVDEMSMDRDIYKS